MKTTPVNQTNQTASLAFISNELEEEFFNVIDSIDDVIIME